MKARIKKYVTFTIFFFLLLMSFIPSMTGTSPQTIDNPIGEEQMSFTSNLFNFTTKELFGQTLDGIDSADLDGDGDEDFIITYRRANSMAGHLAFLYMEGMDYVREEVYTFCRGIKDVCLEDFDNDGDYDILYTFSDTQWYGGWGVFTNGTGDLLLNNGDNTFSEPMQVFYLDGGIPFDEDNRIHPKLSSNDFDNDGDIDFLVTDQSGTVELFLNHGNASFYSEGPLFDMGYFALGVDVADFNQDNYLDLMISSGYDPEDYFHGCISVFLNTQESDCFQNSSEIVVAEMPPDIDLPIFGTLSSSGSLQIIDYDKDGELDFLLGLENFLFLYMNDGDLTYAPYLVWRFPNVLFDDTEYSEDLRWGALYCIDLDDDGYEDLITGGVQGYLRFGLNLHSLVFLKTPCFKSLYFFGDLKMRLKEWDDRVVIGGINVVVDNLSELDHVDFIVNDQVRYSDDEAPYEWFWRSFRFGKCILTVKGYGEGGEYLGEHSVEVLKIL